MLLNFRTKNYKSFRSELDFSMIPASKQKGLDYSIHSIKIGKKSYKALSSAVIYGPNASGKTNIIGAMDTFCEIIQRGNIRNVNDISSPNIASYKLELVPCCTVAVPEPVEFYVEVIDSGLHFEYKLVIDLGIFLDRNYKRKILEETLIVNGVNIFERGENIKLGDLSSIKEYLNDGVINDINKASDIATNGLDYEELFLTNGFKTIFSKKLTFIITDWFANRFMVIYRADSMQIRRRFIDPKEDTVYIEKTTNDAASIFGINSNALGFKANKDKTDSMLYSIFGKGEKQQLVPAEYFESYGTIRFINEFPLVFLALHTGATLVIDEFDASIHPMAIMNIITLFHNDDINTNHAQLIFNTHNPIFLSPKLYRRDEIKFVERDEVTHESTHYSLSDFKTYGKVGVRKGEDYMKNYFVNRYGAIKDIDFSPIMTNNKKSEGDNTNE